MRLRLFQFSLRDQASNWIERLPARSITTWEDLTTRFLAQFFPSGRTAKLRNDILIRTIDQSAGGKLRDLNVEESWALLEDLALYDNESWNDLRYFAKPVKEIALSQDVPMNKVTTSCEIYSGPHDTQYCMEDPEQAFVEYASSRTDEARILSARSYPTMDPQCSTHVHGSINAVTICPEQQSDPQDSRTEENEEEEKDKPENIHFDSSTPPDPSVSFITEKVLKFNLLGLVPPSSNTELICTKEEDGDIMFIEIGPKDDDSRKEEPEAGEQEVEHFDMSQLGVNSHITSTLCVVQSVTSGNFRNFKGLF
ncbi:MAK10-like protein [Tanacetum coccineum]|uniref:MAK10-like protein n=1 Tax=Tanacetum coccineum TaxID=301880 RepID=A0ABQ5AFP3_9ASTR